MSFLFFPCLGFQQTQLQRCLTGKTVLITGASYGIGESLAILLADTPAHLLLVARTVEKLRRVQERVIAKGGRADIFPCDLRNPAEVAALVEQVQQCADGIDILVSNAGKSIRRSIFASLDRFHDFTRTINVNYLGPVQLILALTPTLIAQGGQVINISAVNVLLAPVPQWAAYQASKTAFDQWFRCVSPEFNARGLATTSIYLPLVRTRMIAPTKAYRNLPAMAPEEVARLICKAILSRRRVYAPWWLLFGQLASAILWWPVALVLTRLSKSSG